MRVIIQSYSHHVFVQDMRGVMRDRAMRKAMIEMTVDVSVERWCSHRACLFVLIQCAV